MPGSAMLAVAATAQAPAAAEDTLLAASRQAFEALPESERKAVQDALIWVGVYNATSGGNFGRQTYAGINAYQKAAGAAANGVLTPDQTTRLKAEAAAKRGTAGFQIVRDARSGVEIGVPASLLPKQSGNNFGGSRWQSADDKITLDTRVIAGGAEEFQAQYERNIATAPGRKVTYKLQRPDFFVVTGETAGGEFYVRYALGPEGLRGFTLAYDKSVRADFNRVMIAIANSFTPFPTGDATSASSAAFGAAKPLPTQRAGKDGTPAVPSSPAAPVRAAANVTAATGVHIGPRQVVTTGLACKNPMVAGITAKVIKQDGDLALLEVAQDKVVALLPLRSGPVPAGAGLVVIAWDASTGEAGVASASGGEGEDLTAALQAGGRGGLVFDRAGAVVGLVGNARTSMRAISGVLTPASYAVIKVKAVQDFSGGNGGFAGEPVQTEAQSAGAIAATASSRIVGIVCP